MYAVLSVCDLMKAQASGDDLQKERQMNGSFHEKHFVLF